MTTRRIQRGRRASDITPSSLGTLSAALSSYPPRPRSDRDALPSQAPQHGPLPISSLATSASLTRASHVRRHHHGDTTTTPLPAPGTSPPAQAMAIAMASRMELASHSLDRPRSWSTSNDGAALAPAWDSADDPDAGAVGSCPCDDDEGGGGGTAAV